MHSKKIKIAVWAFAAILLIGILVLGIREFAFGMDISGVGFVTTYSFSDSETYEKGGVALPADTNISALELEWLSGEVDIRFYDGDQISFEETAARALSEAEVLCYKISGQKLMIRYCEPKTGLNRFSKMPEKSIKILIPRRSGMEILVKSVSSSVYVNGSQQTLGNLSVESVSGAVMITDASTPVLKASSVSGSITFHGSAKKADIETVSGRVMLDFDETPKNLSVDSISGSIAVNLSDGVGFTATLDSISGKLACDFAEMAGNKKAVYRDGSARFHFETISGMATITLSDDAPLATDENLGDEPEIEGAPALEPVDGVPASPGGRKF